jgi:hypothetical protein
MEQHLRLSFSQHAALAALPHSNVCMCKCIFVHLFEEIGFNEFVEHFVTLCKLIQSSMPANHQQSTKKIYGVSHFQSCDAHEH